MQPAHPPPHQVIIVQQASMEPRNCCGTVTKTAVVLAWVQLALQVATAVFAYPVFTSQYFRGYWHEGTAMVLTVMAAVCALLFLIGAILVQKGISAKNPNMLIAPIVFNIIGVIFSMAGLLGLILYVWNATVFCSARNYLKSLSMTPAGAPPMQYGQTQIQGVYTMPTAPPPMQPAAPHFEPPPKYDDAPPPKYA